MTIQEFILFGWVVAGLVGVYYGLRMWFQKAEVHPDPWGPEVDEAINEPDAKPVCPHCFTLLETENWLCPECGAAIGPYNNYILYAVY